MSCHLIVGCPCVSCTVTRGVLAGPGGVVSVPTDGEWFVKNGKVMKVGESEWQDRVESDDCYIIWVEREGT